MRLLAHISMWLWGTIRDCKLNCFHNVVIVARAHAHHTNEREKKLRRAIDSTSFSLSMYSSKLTLNRNISCIRICLIKMECSSSSGVCDICIEYRISNEKMILTAVYIIPIEWMRSWNPWTYLLDEVSSFKVLNTWHNEPLTRKWEPNNKNKQQQQFKPSDVRRYDILHSLQAVLGSEWDVYGCWFNLAVRFC